MCNVLYYNFRDIKEDKVYSMDKICESNSDCSENEFCDSEIGICVCSNGFQLDNSKKFCLPNTDNNGLNISGYDINEVTNVIPDQQIQLDTFKKVSKKILLFKP